MRRSTHRERARHVGQRRCRSDHPNPRRGRRCRPPEGHRRAVHQGHRHQGRVRRGALRRRPRQAGRRHLHQRRLLRPGHHRRHLDDRVRAVPAAARRPDDRRGHRGPAGRPGLRRQVRGPLHRGAAVGQRRDPVLPLRPLRRRQGEEGLQGRVRLRPGSPHDVAAVPRRRQVLQPAQGEAVRHRGEGRRRDRMARLRAAGGVADGRPGQRGRRHHRRRQPREGAGGVHRPLLHRQGRARPRHHGLVLGPEPVLPGPVGDDALLGARLPDDAGGQQGHRQGGGWPR